MKERGLSMRRIYIWPSFDRILLTTVAACVLVIKQSHRIQCTSIRNWFHHYIEKYGYFNSSYKSNYQSDYIIFLKLTHIYDLPLYRSRYIEFLDHYKRLIYNYTHMKCRSCLYILYFFIYLMHMHFTICNIIELEETRVHQGVKRFLNFYQGQKRKRTNRLNTRCI